MLVRLAEVSEKAKTTKSEDDFVKMHPECALVIEAAFSDGDSDVKEEEAFKATLRITAVDMPAAAFYGGAVAWWVARLNPQSGQSSVLVGRGAGADVRLNHPAISTLHSLLNFEGDVWSIGDQGSSNETWVNGEPVPVGEFTPLRDQDRIRFGPDVCATFMTPESLFQHALSFSSDPEAERTSTEPEPAESAAEEPATDVDAEKVDSVTTEEADSAAEKTEEETDSATAEEATDSATAEEADHAAKETAQAAAAADQERERLEEQAKAAAKELEQAKLDLETKRAGVAVLRTGLEQTQAAQAEVASELALLGEEQASVDAQVAIVREGL